MLLLTRAASLTGVIESETGTRSGIVLRAADPTASTGAYVAFGVAGNNSLTSGGNDTSCIFASAPAGTQPAFCDGFDVPEGIGNRSGDMNGQVWGVSRLSGNGNAWPVYDTFDHDIYVDFLNQTFVSNGGLMCGQSGTFAPPNDLKICNGQLQEGLTSDGGVPALAMYPKQPFDFNGRTGTVVFDVSNDSWGSHDVWPEFWLTDKPVPVPFKHQTSTASVPANGFGIMLSAGCESHGGCLPGCQSSTNTADRFVNIEEAFVFRNYVKQTWVGFNPQGNEQLIQYDGYYQNSATKGCVKIPITGDGQLNHFELRISQNQIDVYGTDAAQPSQMTPAWIQANLKHMATLNNVNLNQTRGLIWIIDGQYNPEKGNPTHMYHRFLWDNVGFDGPKTYRDLAYDVADNTVDNALTYPVNVNSSRTVTVKNVKKGNPTSALLTFNFVISAVTPTINYAINGHAHSIPWPYPTTIDPTTNQLPFGLEPQYFNSGPMTIAIPVDLSEIIEGDNTVTFTTNNDVGIRYSNIDLIMVNGAPVPY